MENTATKKYMNIPMTYELNNRELCRKMAGEIYEHHEITGMSRSQLYCEIFAHAYVFSFFRHIPEFIKNTAPAKRIYRSVADGVDLEDDGDTLVRRIFYRVIWFMPSVA